MQKSYSTKYMVVHLDKDACKDKISEKHKNFPYNILVHGNNHVSPPLSRDELVGLADFIYDFLRETQGIEG